MGKIICFEWVHCSGKWTIINEISPQLIARFWDKFRIVRDCEYPEFLDVKNRIIRKELIWKKAILRELIRVTAWIYRNHINWILEETEVVILDRSYYTSTIWHAEEDGSDIKEITDRFLDAGIPKADKTYVFDADSKVIKQRIIERARPGSNIEHHTRTVEWNLKKYRTLVEKCNECTTISGVRPSQEWASIVLAEIYK